MNSRKPFILLGVVAMLLCASPSFAVSKEIIQLQTQVQALQDQMTAMKQSFDERMGVMRNLIEQTTDNMNKVVNSVDSLNKTLQQQHADAGGRADQLSGQIQALNDSVDELKARMNKLSKQLDDLQAAQQNLNANPAGAQPGQPGATQPPQSQAPPPDVLYNNALRDYNGNNLQLSAQEFQDYLKYYPTTDLAGNAQFYLADILYRQNQMEQAVVEYDKVLEQYPGGNKAAAAQLKKGYALLALGQKQAGVRELNALIVRYPKSIEAQQAREKLRQVGSTASPTRRRG